MSKLFFPGIQHILLHLNDDCNYKCSYCYNQPAKNSVTFDEWVVLLRQSRRFGVRDISILGGEPLLYDRLIDFLAIARKLRYSTIYLYTNGSLIDEFWIKKFKKYKVIPVVKFESCPEVYRGLTRQKEHVLEEIKKNIFACVAAGLSVLTFIVLNKKNIGHIETIVRESLELGAFPVFERFMPVKGDQANVELDITDDEFAQASLEIERIFRPVKFLHIFAQRLKNRTACGCYDNIISVTSSGDVLPCPYLDVSGSLGNIKNQSMEDVGRLYTKSQGQDYGVLGRSARPGEKGAKRCRTYSFNKISSYSASDLEFCDHMNKVGYMLARIKPMKYLQKIFLKRID